MTAIVPQTRVATVQPKAVGDDETIVVFRVRKGDVILWMYAILEIKVGGASSTELATIGDGVDPDGYGDNGDLDAEGTVGAIIPLAGPGVATTNLHTVPKVYPADDTIDLIWDAGDAVAPNPKWKIFMGILESSRA